MLRKSTKIRKEEIKSAVLKIIRTKGIKYVSTKNLAKYTDLSEGAIFRHFKTKRDIIVSIIDDVTTGMIESLRNIADSKQEPYEKLFKYLCYNITYLSKHKGITILLFTEASHFDDKEMKRKLNHIFNAQRELVAKIIKEGVKNGKWNKNISIEAVTQLYMGIPVTYNINLVLSGKKTSNKVFCTSMMKLFEHILAL